MNSTDTQKTDKEETRMQADVTLDDVLGGELKITGADLPDGSYPATLFGFGAPFKMKVTEQFRKEGGPEFKTNFELRFGLRDKQGALVEVAYMCGIPEGGEVNRRSNLWKGISALANGDATLIDEKNGVFMKGVKLTSFLGKTAVLNIKKNKKDFPQVESIGRPMDGVKYPTMEECKALLTSSQGIPF